MGAPAFSTLASRLNFISAMGASEFFTIFSFASVSLFAPDMRSVIALLGAMLIKSEPAMRFNVWSSIHCNTSDLVLSEWLTINLKPCFISCARKTDSH